MAKRASSRAAEGAPRPARASGKVTRATKAKAAETETKVKPAVPSAAKPLGKTARAAVVAAAKPAAPAAKTAAPRTRSTNVAANAMRAEPTGTKAVGAKRATAAKPTAAKPTSSKPTATKQRAAPDKARGTASAKTSTPKKPLENGATPARPARAKKPAKPRYLAAELGTPVDHDGEPVGAGSARARSDEELQKYALDLWRQMQSGRVVNRYTRAIERAGLTVDEVWTAGLAEERTTTSTPDELRRYRQKLLFRANLLEAIFIETIAVLRRLDNVQPAELAAAGSS